MAEAKLQQEMSNTLQQTQQLADSMTLYREELDDHQRQFDFQTNEFVLQQDQISAMNSILAEQVATVAQDFSLQMN